jgi:hypothetical protein
MLAEGPVARHRAHWLDVPKLSLSLARAKVDAVLIWGSWASRRTCAPAGHGVRFVSATQGLDMRHGGDAMSNLIFDVLSAVAERERETVRERTRLGIAHAASTAPGPQAHRSPAVSVSCKASSECVTCGPRAGSGAK